jgi:hypothetical protein
MTDQNETTEYPYQTVSLVKDTDIKDLMEIAEWLNIDPKPPVVIRALIKRAKKDMEVGV